ncbi:hypothetical protein ACUXCC_004836 [Cytobacillus horneckiae]
MKRLGAGKTAEVYEYGEKNYFIIIWLWRTFSKSMSSAS